MSGGPQVFLGATTFLSRCRQISGRRPVSGCRQICGRRPVSGCRQISGRRPVSGCRQISGRREACPPARLGNRAALGASSRSPARPRRPRGGLQSAGPRRRPRAPQSGPAVRPRRPRDDRLLNNVARNSLTRVSNVEVASLELQRFEHILKTDRCKLRATFARGYIVPRRRDNGTPLADAVRGLVLTVIRWLGASSLPRRCTRRSQPRSLWGESNRAGLHGVGST